jgi:uncharacterized Zn ribbon protein
MKFKAKRLDKIRPSSKKFEFEGTIISSEYYENDRPSYICSFCNQSLIRLTDAGMNTQTYWCRHCSIEWDPEEENLRKESKIVVPDRNQEAAITSIQTDLTKEIEINHTPELRGGFAQIAKKGTIRFTSYNTTEKG